jgi:hypothetical protein
MAEVEETREFEQLPVAIVPSVSPPPPYEGRPPGNEETVLTQSMPQVYQVVASPDYDTMIYAYMAAFCGILCICTLPCSIAAMVLAKKVRMHSIKLSYTRLHG